MSDRLLSENAVVEALEARQRYENELYLALGPRTHQRSFGEGRWAGLVQAVETIRALPSSLSPPEGP